MESDEGELATAAITIGDWCPNRFQVPATAGWAGGGELRHSTKTPSGETHPGPIASRTDASSRAGRPKSQRVPQQRVGASFKS